MQCNVKPEDDTEVTSVSIHVFVELLTSNAFSASVTLVGATAKGGSKHTTKVDFE